MNLIAVIFIGLAMGLFVDHSPFLGTAMLMCAYLAWSTPDRFAGRADRFFSE